MAKLLNCQNKNEKNGPMSSENKITLTTEGTHAAEGIVREDVSAVNSAQNRELYSSRQHIHPKQSKGLFRSIKWLAMGVLLAIYYIAPLLRWEREGAISDQFVLADFEHRRFYFGPIEIWPQEVYYITGLLILAGVGLFLATSLFGRVWCGYACPQTVWTDLFIWVEGLFEGDRNQRIRLDKAPWTFDKIWRKVAKHTVWILISIATGGWFVMYFNDAYEVLGGFFKGTAPLSSYIFMIAMAGTTYALAGTMREQVCTYMCPWPRIQAAMLDSEALSVTYRDDRGEKRGPHKKGETWEGRGDCIDCKQCVAVCPAGIDIRDGLQIECINCALCIDACDEVMVKIGRPKGLIGYDTHENVERRKKGEKEQFRFIRGRTIFYSVILVLVSGIMAFGLLTRSTMEVNVIRDRAPLFVQLSDGNVRNVYTVKVVNKAGGKRKLAISIEGVEGGKLHADDGQIIDNSLVIEAEPNKVSKNRIFVVADPSAQKSKSIDVTVRVTDKANGDKTSSRSVFIRGRE